MTPPASDHFNGKTFFQPGAHPERLFRHVLKWKLTSKPAKWPPRVVLPPYPPPPAPADREIVATWLGHATFLVQTSAGNVLFDPVFSDRVSPVAWAGPRRAHPVPIPLGQLPRIDVVCLSHDHYDHWDAATVQWLARASPATVFVTPLRHEDLLRQAGARNVVELDWWQAWRSPAGLDITLTPTKHWSNRLGTPRNHRLWGGFWVEFPAFDSRSPISSPNLGSPPTAPAGHSIGKREIEHQPPRQRRLWFVGDSGYDEPLFREVRERLGVPDVALVPIGAYEPRWFMAPMHMNPDEAVRLHRASGARVSLAMHWGTFQLTDEPRDAPLHALAKARTEQGVGLEAFRVLAPGESVVV